MTTRKPNAGKSSWRGSARRSLKKPRPVKVQRREAKMRHREEVERELVAVASSVETTDRVERAEEATVTRMTMISQLTVSEEVVAAQEVVAKVTSAIEMDAREVRAKTANLTMCTLELLEARLVVVAMEAPEAEADAEIKAAAVKAAADTATTTREETLIVTTRTQRRTLYGKMILMLISITGMDLLQGTTYRIVKVTKHIVLAVVDAVVKAVADEEAKAVKVVKVVADVEVKAAKVVVADVEVKATKVAVGVAVNHPEVVAVTLKARSAVETTIKRIKQPRKQLEGSTS